MRLYDPQIIVIVILHEYASSNTSILSAFFLPVWLSLCTHCTHGYRVCSLWNSAVSSIDWHSSVSRCFGLLVGFFYPWIGALAAGGLSLQMACGLIVRIRIKDSIIQCVPAMFYLLLCAWLAKKLLGVPV